MPSLSLSLGSCICNWGSDQFLRHLLRFSYSVFPLFPLLCHAKYAKSFGACKFPRLCECPCVCVCVCLHIMIIVGTSARNRVRSRVINLDTQLCKRSPACSSSSSSLRAKLLLPVGLPCLPASPSLSPAVLLLLLLV